MFAFPLNIHFRSENKREKRGLPLEIRSLTILYNFWEILDWQFRDDPISLGLSQVFFLITPLELSLIGREFNQLFENETIRPSRIHSYRDEIYISNPNRIITYGRLMVIQKKGGVFSLLKRMFSKLLNLHMPNGQIKGPKPL